ncbi:nascent polypeptide-associated complex subunit alpha, muscle-specific form-like [Lemur catta]|uniref:nascent polypeptide-associated complex subunit alpha, muscle-specific form-like n=1 Tax=Lemur catta TaxID=9447 RepID=UPI001E26B589|nr:nascent polypeptide-associated complex subunit alpha, muscle-specific form-like [Lemur catta]
MPEAPLPRSRPSPSGSEGAERGGARIVRAHRGPGPALPTPFLPPTSPSTPANLPGTPGRKKGRMGKVRPPGLQPQRETPRGKTNLGPALREKWGAGSRGRGAPPVPPLHRETPSPAGAPGTPRPRNSPQTPKLKLRELPARATRRLRLLPALPSSAGPPAPNLRPAAEGNFAASYRIPADSRPPVPLLAARDPLALAAVLPPPAPHRAGAECVPAAPSGLPSDKCWVGTQVCGERGRPWPQEVLPPRPARPLPRRRWERLWPLPGRAKWSRPKEVGRGGVNPLAPSPR